VDQHEHTDLDERLVKLEERIQQLERRLEERQHGGDAPKFYETGSIHPELDDPMIAP
jgi:hypothetical protein